jgi:BRCA2, helical.
VTGIPVGDGAHLVLDAKGTAGVEEVTRAFLSSPGIEVTLVPAGWVQNHYRWLVWKLASVERSFPQQFAARYENLEVNHKEVCFESSGLLSCVTLLSNSLCNSTTYHT